MLIDLLSDWHRKKDVRDDFALDPGPVLDRYEVSQRGREALRSGDGLLIREAMRAELSALVVAVLEEKEGGLLPPPAPWPGGQILVEAVTPSSTIVGVETVVVIQGGCFEGGVQVTFSSPRADVPAKVLRIDKRDPGKLQRMLVTVSFSAGQEGSYDVVVRSADEKGSLPRGFEVLPQAAGAAA